MEEQKLTVLHKHKISDEGETEYAKEKIITYLGKFYTIKKT